MERSIHQAPVPIMPAAAKKVPHSIELHGKTLVDQYFWMRDLEDPDLIPYLKAENHYTQEYLSDTVTMQEKLFQEMRGRSKEADASVPYKIGDWLYYTRTEEGKEYSLICRKKNKRGSAEQILLDINELAKQHEFFQIDAVSVSPSGNFLAYSCDVTGYRQYTLQVKNLRTGETRAPMAERVTSVVWCKDSRNLFYTTEDETTKRSNRLYRQNFRQKAQHLVFDETDESFDVAVGKSLTGAFIYLTSSSHTTSTVSFIASDRPRSAFRLIAPRRPMIRYDVKDDGKNFYIVTNDTGPDFRLVKTPCKKIAPANWIEVIAHKPGVLLMGVDVFANHLVAYEKHSGLTKVRVQRLADGDIHYMDVTESVYEVGPGENAEFNTQALRLTYESMATPSSVLEYDLNLRTSKVLKVDQVKGYDASLYNCERIFATASDGTKVPISLLYKGELKRDGSRPCHVYGYGSYGDGLPADFNQQRLSLVDRGFIYAIAHVRGGNELGEQWRQDGKLMKKMNTFTDFISCIDHLVKDGYTAHDRVTMEGRSAGGLLMGAVLNLAPKAAKAALVTVPFVDVINTMLDESLPLVVAEFEEWGNPKVEAEYNYIRTYSPYENVVATDYPAMLVKTAIKDSQVPYWEAAKYVAKMRELRTDNNPLLLQTMIEAGGHGGPSGRFEAMKDVASEYAFLLKQVGAPAWNV